MNDSMNMTKAFNGGIDKLESFDFRRREILHKNVEIFAAGKIAEFARFAGGERRKSPDRFFFIYPGQRRGYCWRVEDWRSDGVQRSGTEAEWQSSDSLCPLGQVFWRLVRLKSWPGFNVQRWRQRVFEDLLAVLEVSPVRGNRRLPSLNLVEFKEGKCRFYY